MSSTHQEEIRRQLLTLSEQLDSLEPLLDRRNAALEFMRTLTGDAGRYRLEYDEIKEQLSRSVEVLDVEMGVLEKRELDIPSAVSSLGLAVFLSSVPAAARTTHTLSDESVHEEDLDKNSSGDDLEHSSLYEELINNYSAIDRTREYCTMAANELTNIMGAHIRKSNKPLDRLKAEHSAHLMSDMPLETIRSWFKTAAGQWPALSWLVYQLPATGTIIEVVVDRTFRMVILLRGKIIEAVNVRGSEEHFNLEPRALKPLDLWTPSIYETFQIVTQNAQSAILHYYNPWPLDHSLKSYLVWVNSLSSIFSTPCKRCGKFLDGFLPPTWRDYKRLEPYHETCRNLTFSSS